MNPAAPILLFDSGVGGLTVLAELRKLLPQAPVIYAADTAGLPYGEKTEAEVAARVAGLLGRLSERYAPRLITIACNTASTIALGDKNGDGKLDFSEYRRWHAPMIAQRGIPRAWKEDINRPIAQ